MIYKCEKCGARLDPGEKCDCDTKKEEPRGNEDSSSTKKEKENIPTKIISRKRVFVNRLRELRRRVKAKPAEFVAAVRTIYPKYDKTLESKCEHGEDYGVQLRPDAMKYLIEKYDALAKTADTHRLKGRVSCRLTTDACETFKIYIDERGYYTVQDYLSEYITDLLKRTSNRFLNAKAQRCYCLRNGVPLRVALNGLCPNCYINIYDKLDLLTAGTKHITECPNCGQELILKRGTDNGKS